MDYITETQLKTRLSKLKSYPFDPKKIPDILKEISEMLFELYDRIDKLENRLKQSGLKKI